MTRLVEHISSPVDPAAAFAYIADFGRQAEWDPNTVSSRRIGPGAVGAGSRFALEVKAGPRVRPMEYRITEYEPPSRVVLVGEGSGIWSRDEITFSAVPGGTQVIYDVEIRLRGLLGLIQPLLGRAFAGIAKGAAAGMQRELDALAAATAAPGREVDAESRP